MRIWPVTLLLALATVVTGIEAQQVPINQALQRLIGNPQGGEAVRQRILRSGLTPDQIRQQLQAGGLSTNILDPYLRAESGIGLIPGDSVVQALSLLGIGTAGSLAAFADSLRFAGITDTTVMDSIAVDSVAYRRFITRYGALLADSLLLIPKKPELELFGLDVFRQATTEFLPDLSGPVGDDYRLGAGDVLVLILTGDLEAAYTLEVTREGFVVIPQVGRVFVNSLALQELRILLGQRLAQVYSGVPNGTTQFEVTVARVRMAQVFVLGEVIRPGSYRTPSVATVLTALYQAGGPTESGNLREIRVLRGTDTVATLDLYEYLQTGTARGDSRLESGDVVFVPLHGPRVKIGGAVVRPGVYELRSGETMSDLVSTAGGLREDAAVERVSVSRIVPASQRTPGTSNRIVVDVALEHASPTVVPPFALEAGDSMVVLAVDSTRRAIVEVRGAVYLPGTFGWRPGLRLSDVINLAGGFRRAVYTGTAHIQRLNPMDSTRFLVTASLPEDSTEAYPEDVSLQEYDVVTIYGRDDLRTNRTVSIGGMVNRPGAYPFLGRMTLRDLVLMAGGLRDGAFLDSAEIGRLPPGGVRDGQLAVTLRVPMDSTHLFERASTSYPLLPGPPTAAPLATDNLLQPFDRVTILQQPDFELQRTVWITGEVNFPGPYTLTRKDERVSDLVRRAGGLLPSAYAEGARFVRRLDDAGRVNVELARAIAQPAGRQDVILQPEDSLDVPEFLPTVRVIGAVTSPTSVLYQQGAGAGYYIDNAGGYARGADAGRTSVRYANGSARVRSKFLFFSSTPKPGPGSTVFVPERNAADRFDLAGFLTSLVSVVGSITTVIVVLTR